MSAQSGSFEPAELGGIAADRETRRRGRRRLIGLLFLFDLLLIAAVLLSFRGTELVETERLLLQTKEVVDVLYRQETVTSTVVITRVIPYGAEPPQ